MSKTEDEMYTAESFDDWATASLSPEARRWLLGVTEEVLRGLYWAYVSSAHAGGLKLTAFVIEADAKGYYSGSKQPY